MGNDITGFEVACPLRGPQEQLLTPSEGGSLHAGKGKGGFKLGKKGLADSIVVSEKTCVRRPYKG